MTPAERRKLIRGIIRDTLPGLLNSTAVLRLASKIDEGIPMLTDPLDNTADRRKAAADAGPVILYGNPSKEEFAAARGVAGSRGVMVLPEEMRGSMIASGGGWWSPTPDETMENLTPPADEPASEHPGFEDDGLESHEWEGDPHFGREYDHYTERARVICAGGDHESAVALDRDAERVKVREAERRFQDREHWSDTVKSENVEATLAEEPIEQRLRRAWLNGFRDGVDRASFAATESTGKWDY
jgi:hypothetical protein